MIGIRVHFDAETGEVRIAAKDVAKLGRQVDRAGKDMARADRAAKGWIARLKAAHPVMAKVAKYAVPTLGVAGLVSGLKSLGRHVVDSGVRMERWRSSLQAATGSGRLAAREIGFLREQAERLGLDFGTLANSYSGFANATKGTAIAGEQTRRVFVGVAEAVAVLRLSADDTRGVMQALEQMVSKGTVSAEELRGQLGERLAGAFQIAARAMGHTTEELGQLLQQGKIAADDLLPKLAAQLRVEFGAGLDAATNSAQASFARLGNAFEDLGNAVAESGLLDWLGDLAGAAAAAVRTVSGTQVGSPTSQAQARLDELLGERRDLAEASVGRQAVDILFLPTVNIKATSSATLPLRGAQKSPNAPAHPQATKTDKTPDFSRRIFVTHKIAKQTPATYAIVTIAMQPPPVPIAPHAAVCHTTRNCRIGSWPNSRC